MWTRYSDARYLAGVVSCNPDTVGEDSNLTLISLIFSRPAERRYLHRGSLTLIPLDCVTVRHHRTNEK